MSRPNFRDQLRPFQNVTVDELQAAMEKIPAQIVSRLAEGPLPHRYDCRVCVAFTRRWYSTEGVWDRTNPMHVVFCYHEVPKIDMVKADDQWHGPAAQDVYERCMTTYRIAKELSERR